VEQRRWSGRCDWLRHDFPLVNFPVSRGRKVMNYHRGLHRFAVFTACATFGLLVMGALVTSNNAGLSVPDWPLSYGSLTPPMVDGIVYEHSHRMVAASVGLLMIALTIWLRRQEERRWVRRLGYLAMTAIVVQGLLGGLTVLLKLPPAVSILHASLAQIFFGLVVTVAFVTSSRWVEQSAPVRQYLLPLVATAAIFGQMVLGAVLRHAGTVDGEKGAKLVVAALVAHLIGAGVVMIVVTLLGIRLAGPGRPVSSMATAFILFGMLGLQVVLGVGSYLTRLEAAEGGRPLIFGVTFTASHVAVGAAMLAICLITTLRESRAGSPAIPPSGFQLAGSQGRA
jgi:cytochrome c oxidase assembly protein subunit 15